MTHPTNTPTVGEVHAQVLAALKRCQVVLAMLTEPESIRSTSVHNAWAQAVAAEAEARSALRSAASIGGGEA